MSSEIELIRLNQNGVKSGFNGCMVLTQIGKRFPAYRRLIKNP